MPINSKKTNQTKKANLLKSLISQGKEFSLVINGKHPNIQLSGLDRTNPAFAFSLDPKDDDLTRIQVANDVLKAEMILDFSPKFLQVKKSALTPAFCQSTAQKMKKGHHKPLFSVKAEISIPLTAIYVIADMTTAQQTVFESDMPLELKISGDIDQEDDDGLTPEEEQALKESFANAIRQVFSSQIGQDEADKLANDFLTGENPHDDLSAEEKADIEKICEDAVKSTIQDFKDQGRNWDFLGKPTNK